MERNFCGTGGNGGFTEWWDIRKSVTPDWKQSVWLFRSVPFSSLPMRRPSNEALGSSADLVLRKRTRKITRQEDLKAYLPRQ